MDELTRERHLERLFGDDPTEDEICAMWTDRPRLERLLALRENMDDDYEDLHPLQGYDFELWRAKLRTELGSLSGVLDALAICQEHNLIHPDWLSNKSMDLISYLGLPASNKKFKKARSGFMAERKKLIMQKRAKVVHDLYFRKDLTNRFPDLRGLFEKSPMSHEVEQAIHRGDILPDPQVSSIRDASELAEVCLRGTWAHAAEETIRQDYIEAQVQIRPGLGLGKLSDRQRLFAFWDVAFARPDTLERLGLAKAE